ncbi:VOC family protein [Bacillus sp. Bva_UNVM-123]|uniref:VOC family protein n=1 Tax=Bacillus sp. Bva_UNVM-123 TaxID=2829798 RepID=UPI00391F91A8
MEVKLDHVVHFMNNHPIEAVNMWKTFGYKAVMGGNHEQWGTFNSLLYFHSSYIEFLSINDMMSANNSDNPLVSQLVSDLPKGEGIAQICFRTTDIVEVKRNLEEKGCKTLPIFNGSRKREDGSVLKWKMLFVRQSIPLLYPFFIEWEQNDVERYAEMKAKGMIDRKLENNDLKAIYFAAKNCENTAEDWSRLFNLDSIHAPINNSLMSKMAGVRIGNTNIFFCEPLSEKGIVYHTLNTRGERPFQVQFQHPIYHEPISLYGSEYV